VSVVIGLKFDCHEDMDTGQCYLFHFILLDADLQLFYLI